MDLVLKEFKAIGLSTDIRDTIDSLLKCADPLFLACFPHNFLHLAVTKGKEFAFTLFLPFLEACKDLSNCFFKNEQITMIIFKNKYKKTTYNGSVLETLDHKIEVSLTKGGRHLL